MGKNARRRRRHGRAKRGSGRGRPQPRALHGWTVVPVGTGDLLRPPGASCFPPVIERVARDIGAYLHEVTGHADEDPLTLILGGLISAQLAGRGGPDADWVCLDVDAVLEQLPELLHVDGLIFLISLVTWLYNNGRLDLASAERAIVALRQRENDQVVALRTLVANAPASLHARYETERLARVAARRAGGADRN